MLRAVCSRFWCTHNTGAARSLLLTCLLLCSHSPVLAAEQSSPARLASQSLLLDITRIEQKFVAVGERGHLLISTDKGRNWRQIQVPTRSQLTAVYFQSKTHGWAVGHDAVILSTTDGGETWSLQHFDKQYDDPLLDVWFGDEKNGYAIGAYGLFLSTNNGGKSWDRRQISEDDFHLNAITSFNENELFIAAEQGNLYHSTDGGYSWSSIPSPYPGSFFGISAISENMILVYGLRGHLYHSTDKGQNWQEIPTGTEASLMDAIVLKNGTIHIVGLGGNILTSTNQAKSFSLKTRSDRKTLTAITENKDGQLVMSGSAGISIDDGVSSE